MDETEDIRRVLVPLINQNAAENDDFAETLVQEYGQDNVFSTNDLREKFDVESFMAPFVLVTRKSDGKKGLLTFSHSPRFYFDFQPD